MIIIIIIIIIIITKLIGNWFHSNLYARDFVPFVKHIHISPTVINIFKRALCKIIATGENIIVSYHNTICVVHGKASLTCDPMSRALKNRYSSFTQDKQHLADSIHE